MDNKKKKNTTKRGMKMREKVKKEFKRVAIRKTQSIVIKLFFGGNLEKLDFPLNCKSKNRPFKKQ